jgi:hypothetical protein
MMDVPLPDGEPLYHVAVDGPERQGEPVVRHDPKTPIWMAFHLPTRGAAIVRPHESFTSARGLDNLKALNQHSLQSRNAL